MADDLSKLVTTTEEALRSADDRKNYENLWDDIARYAVPVKRGFLEELSPGVERHRFVYDSTAPRALELFMAFMTNLLVPKQLDWVKLKFATFSGGLAEKRDLEENLTKTLMREMARPDTHFYQSVSKAFISLGAFGSSVIYCDWMDDHLVFESVPLSTVVFDENMDGRVDKVIRTWETTADKAAARSKEWEAHFKHHYKLDGNKPPEVTILHYVSRITPAIKSKLPPKIAKNFKYCSIWVDKNRNAVIGTGGFDVMPYIVSRWLKATEKSPYGRSPAMTALPDIRMVNAVDETVIRIGELQAYPPTISRRGSLISPLSKKPGGHSFYEGDRPELLFPGGSGSPATADVILRRKQQAIREAFFIPLFADPSAAVKTATQVIAETAERNRAVSPMVDRQQDEMLTPLIERIVHLLAREKRFPNIPEDVGTIEPDFINQLQSSQRQIEAEGTRALLSEIAVMAGFDPTVLDVIDPVKAAEIFRIGYGAPASVLASQKDIDAKQEARQQAQQSQQSLQEAQLGIQAAEASAKITKANQA